MVTRGRDMIEIDRITLYLLLTKHTMLTAEGPPRRCPYELSARCMGVGGVTDCTGGRPLFRYEDI